MSGHSRWHKVRQYKGAIDAKRASVFTKMVKNVTIAARDGGGDPDMNFTLRMAIDRAKAANVPKENIERAIKRGTGEIEGGRIDEAVYEGVGPAKTQLVIVALTDNKNRTISDLKLIFGDYEGAAIGAMGSVTWNFDKLGVIRIKNDKFNDESELAFIEAGAENILREEEGITITSSVNNLNNLIICAQKLGLSLESSGIEYWPKQTKQLTEAEQAELSKILEELEDNDDIDSVYHNAQ